MKVDDTLLDRFLDGEATQEEMQIIADWLETSTNLKHYASRAELHVNLRRSLQRHQIQREALNLCDVPSTQKKIAVSHRPQINTPVEPDQSNVLPKEMAGPELAFGNADRTTPVTLPTHPHRVWGLALLALASAAMLLIVLLRSNETGVNGASTAIANLGIATIAFQSNAAWEEFGLSKGDSLDVGIFQLDVGIARLDFSSGASITLQGPTKFEIMSSAQTRLHCGILTAQIPESAAGFEVFTPAMDVTDLGTAFGVAVAANGETDVCVFEGKVEVSSSGKEQTVPRLIHEGNAVRSMPQANKIESVAYETKKFEDGWPVTSGVLQATGLMKFVSPGPEFVPGRYEDNEHILVFLERTNVELRSELLVDLAEPGLYQRSRPVPKYHLKEGQRIRSYLLQLDPRDQSTDEAFNRSRVVGQITFDKPILGLIVRSNKLNATDRELGHPHGDYTKTRRGIEPPSGETPTLSGRDVVTLSKNQKTLSLDLSAAMAIDQIRVIVSDTESKIDE